MAVRQRRKLIRLKGKVEMMVLSPARMFALKMVELTKRRVLRFLLSVTRMEKIRNGYVRGTVQVEHIGNKLGEAG